MREDGLHNIIHQIWFPFLHRFREDREPVLHFKEPDALRRELDFTLDAEKESDPLELEQILAKVVEYTPNVWSPNYLSYLYSSPDPVGLIGDWLASLINSNVHAYEASPVFAMAEIELIKALAKTIGYGAKSSGIFCPGGSYSNMYAMYLARKHYFPETTDDGLCRESRLIIFTSEQSHYSIDKAAALLGLGAKSVRRVRCDRHGRLMPDDLRQQIENAESRGERPFFVNATLGTTVLGAFDPLVDIHRLLSNRKVWLHVDAAWGGAVFMSDKRRDASKGIERADSITWDFHKAMRSPLLCSALLVKDGLNLKKSFTVDASYLFHDNEEIEDYQLGEKTPQCGRRADAFKFWLMWKVRGKKYFTRQVENRFSKTAEAVDMLKKRECFWLYDDAPEFWNVCFWYVPAHLRNIGSVKQCRREDKATLEKITVDLSRCLRKDGQILINFARVNNFPAFFRLIIGHRLTRENIKKILDIIESLGSVLSSSLPKLLTSGGDSRLLLDERGMNSIMIAPEPVDTCMVSRSSCTGSYISEENFRYHTSLLARVRAARISFPECMHNLHDRIRNLLEIDAKTSVITVPSGTDAEYIPLLIAKACAGYEGRIVNIVTGDREIGTHSSTAANGRYFNTLTPCGEKVGFGKSLGGIGHNVNVITVPQYHPLTGKQKRDNRVWVEHVERSLSQPGTVVLLHIVDSSKLGRRMDVIDEVEDLRRRYCGRLQVTIDSCQSRTDIHRTRNYLKLGYMVMITGSKFEEGPPFSGAVIVPSQLTDTLAAKNFINLLPGIGDFLTQYDVSGDMEMIRPYLPSWMNWGLMIRWKCALINWENFRKIDDATRNRLIQHWADGILKLIEQYPEIEVLNGGEVQSGSVGNRNTIISLKLISNGSPLPIKILKKIYCWLYEDMGGRLPDILRLTHAKQKALRRSFLIGQPVDLGSFAVLRIALGTGLVHFMEKHGVDRALEDDGVLLLKMSLLAKYHDVVDTLLSNAQLPMGHDGIKPEKMKAV